jgi:hypothetical protein
MNNEPVAYRHWMIDEEFPEDSCWEYFDAPTGEDCKECIPLYTHPAKTLTDEAIITVADPLNLWNVPKDKLIEFARAILKKASEK